MPSVVAVCISEKKGVMNKDCANPITTVLIFQCYCFMNTALMRWILFC